jgi:hypothetical protein
MKRRTFFVGLFGGVAAISCQKQRQATGPVEPASVVLRLDYPGPRLAVVYQVPWEHRDAVKARLEERDIEFWGERFEIANRDIWFCNYSGEWEWWNHHRPTNIAEKKFSSVKVSPKQLRHLAARSKCFFTEPMEYVVLKDETIC